MYRRQMKTIEKIRPKTVRLNSFILYFKNIMYAEYPLQLH